VSKDTGIFGKVVGDDVIGISGLIGKEDIIAED
jgi:hypothetical protein